MNCTKLEIFFWRNGPLHQYGKNYLEDLCIKLEKITNRAFASNWKIGKFVNSSKKKKKEEEESRI